MYFYYYYLLGEDGSASVQIARICSLGREESRRAHLTYSGKRLSIRPPVGRFGWRCLHRGGVVQGDSRLDLGRSGDALATQSIFRTGAFSLTVVADALEVAGAWVARRRLRGIGGGCHCWWLFEVGVV